MGDRMRRVGILILAFALLGAFLSGANASSFIIACPYHHTLPDDPIVYPGQPGASHSHDFFGNTTTDAYSTADSMHAGSTTCANKGDLAGYWVPSAYLNGSRLMPSRVKAYYYRKVSGTLTPFPDGFQMIAGNAHATGTQSTKVVYFGCGNGSGISKKTAPPDCTGHSSFLEVHVLFPDCWDGGTGLAYSTMNGGSCPAAYPTHFPQLVQAVIYPSSNADFRGITFASGPSYTYHADYFSIWSPGVLEGLVATL
jgi:hypothetical protein